MQQIKEKIRQHLSQVGESTAKLITAKIGMNKYPSDVVKALSEMRTDAEIECEKRKGKGNELWYWLTSIKSDVTLSDNGETLHAKMACDKEIERLRATLALAEKQRNDHFERAESLQKALENADSKLGHLGTMLINIEGEDIESKLGKVLHENLHATHRISDLEDDVRRHSERADDGERANGAWLSLAAEYECKSIPDLRVFIESLERRVDVLKMAVESMHEQLDAKQRNTSFDVSSAAQYIVKTPSRPPRFTKLHKNAHAVAMSSARQHGFAEVFALIPVGKAIRGAEWRPK